MDVSGISRLVLAFAAAAALTACGGGGGGGSSGSGLTVQQASAPAAPPVAMPKVKPGDPYPPIAQIRPSVLIAPHGASREDNYFWLANRKDDAVVNYLKEENAYADKMTAKTATLQDRLRTEIRTHIPSSAETPPFKMGNYYYVERYPHGADYFVLTRRQGSLSGFEEPVIDFNQAAAAQNQFVLRHYATSSDGQLFGYSADINGDRLHTIWFKDLASGQMLPDKIEFVAQDFVIAPDKKSVYYIKLQRGSLRSATVMRRVLGTDGRNDQEVYNERDETFDLSIAQSKGGRYLFITSDSTLTSDVRLIDLRDPNASVQVIRPRERGVKYYAQEVGGQIYLRTNLNAPDYRIVKTNGGALSAWTDLVPHTAGSFIRGFDVTTQYIAVDESTAGAARIRIGSFTTGKERSIPLDEPAGYAAATDDWRFPEARNTDPDSVTLRYGASSIVSPKTIVDFNTQTGTKTTLSRAAIPGYDPSNYEVRRVFAAAPDGARIPVTVAVRRDKKRAGGNPLLLTGYGAYGISNDAVFNERNPVLLDRGFAIAYAGVRGGREMGQAWYEAGKLRNKNNSFTDFIAAAEYLAEAGIADRDYLFAQGRSAGGLLVGAAVNLRPDLFRGVIAGVPFVDVVTTMLDSGIPLTTFEYDEWGNPENPGDYQFMLGYSPYDNVKPRDYPAMLVTAGFNDTQVGYFEPAKWVAKLRVTKTDTNPLLFRVNMGAGHGGNSGRFGRVEDLAFETAFLVNLLNEGRAADKAKAEQEAEDKKSTLQKARDALGL
jgi:oligopeptidase B